MKNNYTAPELEITVIAADDILTSSPQNDVLLDGSILYK